MAETTNGGKWNMTVDEASDDDVSVVELSGGEPRSRSRRWVGVVLGSSVVVGLVAGALLLARPDADRAETALTQAQSFVTDQTSYTYEATVTETFGTDVSDGPGTVTTSRTNDVVEVAGPDRWHVVSDSGDFADEVLRIDDVAWSRSAATVADLAGETWAEYPADAFEMDEADLETLEEDLEVLEEDLGALEDAPDGFDFDFADEMFTAFSFAEDPAATIELIREATNPQVVATSSAGTTLQVSVEDLPDFVGEDVAAQLELDLDADDVPTALRIEASGDDVTWDIDIRFTDWNPELDLDAPDADAIDATPWVDEEAILGYSASAVFAPSVVPDGFELVTVGVMPADEEFFLPCDAVVLSYFVTADDPTATSWIPSFLSVSSTSASCLGPDGTFGEHPLLGGFFGEESREVVLGDTVVRIDTTLSAAEIDAIAASLAPADLPALLEALPTTAEQLDAFPFGG